MFVTKPHPRHIIGVQLMAYLKILSLVLFVESTHFRGAVIQWRPVDPDNFDGQVYRIVK